MLEHSLGLNKIIQKRILQGCDYLETLRTLYGADPREVWDIFKQFKQESKKKIGLTNSYPEFPEPHPAYSQWRITPDSAKVILEKLIEKNYEKICFLGCPVLGIEFKKLIPNRGILLDIDKCILNHAEKFTEAIEYDVNDKLPPKLRNKFECTIVDPPWYYDDIKLFIRRASELTKIGGTIYSSLPQLLTKPFILEERLDFQQWLSNSNLVLAELNPVVEYEVPAFEYMAYKDVPAFTGEVWRRGDWMKLKKLEDSDSNLKINKIKSKWIEYSFDRKRIFLRDKHDDVLEEPRLSALYKDNSLILKTVSKRSLLIPKIDIWSSRNAVLHIDSGYSSIKRILNNLNKRDKDILEILPQEHKNASVKSIKKIRGLVAI